MPLKNDWQNGDLFTPAAANDMANAVNGATNVTVEGSPASSYEIDPKPLTASDVGAYTRTEVDESINAVLNAPTITNAKLVTPALGTPTSGNLTNCTFPTLNQSTTGSAATLTTGRNITTNLGSTTAASFNGSANVTPGVSGTLAIANGGTNATTESTARTNLGLAIGTDVQAHSSNLTSFASKTAPSGDVVGTTDTQTMSGKTITGTKETVHAIVDGAAFEIDPANGGIQTLTLGAARTPKATNFSSGQSLTLMIAATTYAITWTDATLTPTWVGGVAPVLSSTKQTVLSFWKVSSTIYGAIVGYA